MLRARTYGRVGLENLEPRQMLASTPLTVTTLVTSGGLQLRVESGNKSDSISVIGPAITHVSPRNCTDTLS